MFDFSLLRSLPKPTWSGLFCLLVFGGLACFHFHLSSIPDEIAQGALMGFLERERSANPKHPQILIGGSSLSGMGFHVEELERRMGMPAAKAILDGGSFSDTLDILECYPEECQYAKIIFYDMRPATLKHSYVTGEVRRRFFDKIRGDEKFDFFADCIDKRNSLTYFIRSCGRRILRTSGLHFEIAWNNPELMGKHGPDKIILRQQAEQARRNRTYLISESLPPVTNDDATNKESNLGEDRIEVVYRLLNLCRSRKIFVVICITPEWYGQLNFSQKDLEIPTEEPYLLLLQELNERPDCRVIICRDFEEITNEGTDEDYLLDYGHMTRQGAIVYTNWLVDRLLDSPKTAGLVQSQEAE
jgi:hypothetical protein